MTVSLITGGLGFVGRHIAAQCLKQGHEVYIVDTSHEPCTQHNKRIVVREDIRKWMSTIGTVAAPDYIFHCAAVVGGRANIDGNPLAVAQNLSIDAEFFRWVAGLKKKPQRVVYFSSSAVYPVNRQTKEFHSPLEETFAPESSRDVYLKPDGTYGLSKMVGELLAQIAVAKHNVPVVIYRPFSGYGEDQSLDYPFPSIIKRIVEGNNPVDVWGDGNQVRDWIHIDDIVEAVLTTMMVLEPGNVINLGTGLATSFADLVRMAGFVLKRKELAITPHRDKPEGCFWRVANVSKMHKLYVPFVSLEEGIKRCALVF
jgi:nucleoside-diphosphate-sugar epimerase